MNVHAAWRMALAQRAAPVYARNEKLAAFAVAGSVGAGLADPFSDLELDCYWSDPPDERDRTAPIDALGGQVTALWDYDHDDQEWSEDYRIGELDVTVSNFPTAAIERFLDDVLLRADTDPVKHMRLASLQNSEPLVGSALDAGAAGGAARVDHRRAARRGARGRRGAAGGRRAARAHAHRRRHRRLP